MEALIQELPKFVLKAVPTECNECPICLEEFHVGNEVGFSMQSCKLLPFFYFFLIWPCNICHVIKNLPS